MTIHGRQTARKFHDIRNLLSALLLGVGNLKTDPDPSLHRQASLEMLESMIYEISLIVDELAESRTTASRATSPSASGKPKSISETTKESPRESSR